MVENAYSRNVKLRSAITPVLLNIEPYSLRAAWGFWIWRIEWCDRHLCYVTGSDYAQLNAPFASGRPLIRRHSCY